MKPQTQPAHDAEVNAEPSNGFHKRTVGPLGFLAAVASIAIEAPTALKVWGLGALDPGFRETLMLAVARYNDAKYCSWAHRQWASINGVPEDDLAHLERLDRVHFDPKTWLAISFVRELVAAGFGSVPSELARDMEANYSPAEIEEITLVAKVMDLLNVSSNTFEAFLSRLNGKPSPQGAVVDEAIISAVFCCALPPLFTFFSWSSQLSTDELARRMVEYTMRMDAEAAAGERPREQPARGR